MATLYDFPTVYDQIVQPGPCAAFYSELARETGGPVLELACGTGRLTVPLARQGHRFVGLDASAAMLAQARRKAEIENIEVTFLHADMRSFDVGQLFALIIVSCNSLAHLIAAQDIRACLTRVARHLAPGGTLAFDIVNPNVRALGRSGDEPVRLDAGPNPCSGIAVEEIGVYDPVQQLRVLRWRIQEPGVAVQDLAPLVLRQFFPQEVPLLLEAAGLELVARYGDFARNPFTGDSLNQVCVSRARLAS